MGIETAEDRAVFLNPDEFGEGATLFPGSPSARTIAVVYEESWTAADPETDVPVSSTTPRLFARTDDLSGVEQGDRVAVAGKVWRFADLQPDGTGFTIGVLTR